VDEEVVLLEEQLSAAQGDIERLQTQLAEAEARDATRSSAVAELQRRLAEREESLATQTVELEDLRAGVSEAREQARDAVLRVRELIAERAGRRAAADIEVHVDEKWFQEATSGIYLYLPPGVKIEEISRAWHHRNTIPKVMFFAAVGRPRPEFNFSGVVGIWPLVKADFAKRTSKNRERGAPVVHSVTMDFQRFRDVAPASRWPTAKLRDLVSAVLKESGVALAIAEREQLAEEGE